MKNTLLILIAVAVVVGGGAFYGGVKYQASTCNPNPQNFSPEARQQRLSTRGGGPGFINGEIIAKDDKSVTVKLRDGGSKIVFYSDTTEIGKFVNGTVNDLEVGKSVVVSGKANQDGSITAESIQLRSNLQ